MKYEIASFRFETSIGLALNATGCTVRCEWLLYVRRGRSLMTIAIAGLKFASGNPRDQDESCFVGRKDKTGFQPIQAIQGNLQAR